ncbi:DUF4199 family protein [Sphingobacterium sp. Mn56C]|uniref:DUF4199 family protein n=1 Tax=Sphingobacterium sp. Mn56C TaxID=3395261 RepID=UPI003BBB5C7E
MANELSKQEKKDGIIYGAIVGVLTVVLSVIGIYHTQSASNYSSLFVVSSALKILGSILAPIGFVYLLKKRNGKNWLFSTALKSIYIFLASSIIVGSLGITITQKLLIERPVLEGSYQNLMNLKIVEMEGKGATDEEIDQQMEVIEKDREFAFEPISFRNTIPPIFISLLLNFIFAMVLALLFRSTQVKK